MRSALCSRRCGTTGREIARYGLRARRIGEANHSGPVANAHTFRQGGNLVTGANWNTIDAADEQMADSGDNGHLLAAGPDILAPRSPHLWSRRQHLQQEGGHLGRLR